MSLEQDGLVAILRGVVPDRVVEIGHVLFEAGFRTIEVPLNSPDPFASIARLSSALGARCLCGAGTVLRPDDVRRVADAGGRLIVSPNTDASVIAKSLELGLEVMPGFMTPTEALAAAAAGANRLKLFPAAPLGAGYLRGLMAVLPHNVGVFAVGGIGANQVAAWVDAGAAGFGFGSELFKPSYSLDEIAARARRLVAANRDAREHNGKNVSANQE